MAGWQTKFQNQTSAGPMRIEFGRGDVTNVCMTSATADTMSEVSGTHDPQSRNVVTNLTYVAGGWLTCSSIATEFHVGAASSQMVGTHIFGEGWIDFTMDESSELAEQQWILFGW